MFTAATEPYANVILETFDGSKYFDHIFSRKHCQFISHFETYVKDLNILSGGRDLKDIIIVDNKVGSYSSHLENGIPIKSFMGDPKDDMLPLLT